jgi:hypothetical protein
MKRSTVNLLITFLVVTLAACAPRSGPQIQTPIPTAVPAGQATPVQIPTDLSPAQRAAVSRLSATLALPPERIFVSSTEAVTWPNGCLGVVLPGVLCTRNEVPGFRIVLSASGKKYEFHTNQDGTSILPALALQVPGPAEDAVIKQLSTNLGHPLNDTKIVSSSAVEWRDTCLGVAVEGIACAQVVTPGYLIVLETTGSQYEYHTNADGSQILPSTLALTWRREGGLAGFCEHLTVYASAEVYGLECRSPGGEKVGNLANILTANEQQQFYSLLNQYGMVTLDLSDPKGVSDGMTRKTALYGNGSAQPGPPDQQAIYQWGELIYQRLYK